MAALAATPSGRSLAPAAAPPVADTAMTGASPATAADLQKQWRLHTRLVKQLREYMADEELSAETMADQLGLSSAASLGRWLKAKGPEGRGMAEMDSKVERYLEDERSDQGSDDQENEDESDEEEEEEQEEQEAADEEEEMVVVQYVNCDGPCKRQLTGDDVVFTDGAIDYCEACYPSLHAQLGLVLTQTTAASCLDEIDGESVDPDAGDADAEQEEEPEVEDVDDEEEKADGAITAVGAPGPDAVQVVDGGAPIGGAVGASGTGDDAANATGEAILVIEEID